MDVSEGEILVVSSMWWYIVLLFLCEVLDDVCVSVVVFFVDDFVYENFLDVYVEF